MKRYIVLLLVVIVTIGAASGQIVRSTSSRITVEKEKKERQESFGDNWVIKVGGGIEMVEPRAVFGYDFSVGYQHDLKLHGTYLGGQVGIGCAVFDGYNGRSGFYSDGPTVFLGPTFGLKRALGDNTIFDGHIGAGYERLIDNSKDDGDDTNRVCWELGLGLWYKRVLFELEYRGSNGFLINTGILFNIGFKF